MFDFDIHNKDTASKEGAKSIDKVLKKFGFVPNIIGVMAEAPATATSYLALADLVETTSFSDTEIQTVLMTINRFHECTLWFLNIHPQADLGCQSNVFMMQSAHSR